MNNPNLLGQLAAATPVGSGDLLGCWLIWLIRLMLLVALGIEIKILTVLYDIKRENDQNRRERNERPSQTNQQASLPLQPATGNLGKLGSQNKNLGLSFGKFRHGSAIMRIKVSYLLAKLVNPVLNLFRRHNSNKRKQPNVES
jgi:hypothetical protein